jgi:CRP/FNR family transcriptional regulator, cyclic AMP receptor protein
MKDAVESKSLRELIAEHAFFRDLAPRHVEVLTEAAMLKDFKAGEVIFEEGDPANRFYLLRSGEVELLSEGEDGHAISVQRIGAGDVLGWSWLFPPYYWHFDARAVRDTTAIFFYGTWLRENCERDHDFGYAMLKRMSGIVIQRLQAARKRLVQLEAAARKA